jgi:hypothetical protein
MTRLTRSTSHALFAALAAAAIGGVLASSCVGNGGSACDGPCACPSEPIFTLEAADGGAVPAGASVSAYMERRCGTLDCHGAPERPMRIYGRFGLRDPSAPNYSGGAATTATELADNYAAVCTIQPEATNDVVEGIGDPSLLYVVQKARGNEAHKGGQIVTVGSPGDNCILGWLRGDPPATVAAACQTAVNGL